jgi:hypothetical protein
VRAHEHAHAHAHAYKIWRYNTRKIKGGEVIGCGVDWDCGQVFFVRNPTHEEPNTTDVFVCRFQLDLKETYPAVGTAPPPPDIRYCGWPD